ncbi:type I-C CRISPR-associated protein Cas8c/Csd1 [Paenibacillus sambharensis]|uniref:Type I-C CRISPR-associated protein Cas8c/Csd1 n=1 Tax=Paenibacillus sambharensis TaxID=1803190 RepID=A0A2W1LWM3_9BACL|nr:type I-C CRISPR-associated protein Cas8c/Csd1 [Paenibacillus sambharensis]PZD95907.1 type I-C CRISPR-associated protein Cas8c/Csd1 [Paenibacillus sambharensis]
MTWLAKLYQTYENNLEAVGKFKKRYNGQEYTLLPVSHTTQSAQIEVILDHNGNFRHAEVVDKSDASTLIPCTEASSNRTSAPVPHPLHDKLVYVAGDYRSYGGVVKKGDPHADYMRQLREWCDSPYGHDKVQCVYRYLMKGTLIADLVRQQILHVDENNSLIERWSSDRPGEKPKIYNVLAGDQNAAFVRFAVEQIGELEHRLWRDESVQNSYIQYYMQKQNERDVCFVTGEMMPYADKHASRIRHSADMAKLISANDNSGFTFRGRFLTSRDAASISYEVSQKAHNALKWLVAKQGMTIDGRVFVVWGTKEEEIPDPFADTYGLNRDEASDAGDATHEEFAQQVKRAIQGYRHNLDYQSDVNIMALDAATPGRMSVVYYRDMNKELFLNKLQEWHGSCYWRHSYHLDQEKKRIVFTGTPSTRDIAFAAYGSGASDTVVKGLLERMLPSILDGRKIPNDIVRNAVSRASNPISMERWEWEKTLSIACSLVNNTQWNEGKGFQVALDTNNINRDYLFGRMLAIADVLERTALGWEEKRATNAVRYMNAFAQRPARTWTVIQSNLQPYQARMGMDAGFYNRLLDQVGSQLQPEDFTDKPLGGLYLLGFYSQRQDLYTSKKDKEFKASSEATELHTTEQGRE